MHLTGVYIQKAFIAFYLYPGTELMITGVFSVSDSTDVIDTLGDASVDLTSIIYEGTGNTNGFVLSGTSRLSFDAVPAIVSTNNFSPDGSNFFTYAQMPVNTLGWFARSYGKTPFHHGTCSLDGGFPSSCVFVTYPDVICTVSLNSTTPGALSVDLIATSLTVYGPGGSTDVVNILCEDP